MTTTAATTERVCSCGHRIGQHELRSGGLLGCYLQGCLCIDFAARVEWVQVKGESRCRVRAEWASGMVTWCGWLLSRPRSEADPSLSECAGCEAYRAKDEAETATWMADA